MAAFIGFYRPVPEYVQENQRRVRSEGPSPDTKFMRLVADLPEQLPSSCRILGAWATQAGNVLSDPGPPSVLVIETDNPDDCFFISQYYNGYLQFQWMPARSIGTTREEREAAMAQAATPAGATR